jgi:hypothetical protein
MLKFAVGNTSVSSTQCKCINHCDIIDFTSSLSYSNLESGGSSVLNVYKWFLDGIEIKNRIDDGAMQQIVSYTVEVMLIMTIFEFLKFSRTEFGFPVYANKC